ncbi:LysR family transcriptional regulator [Acuticoccus mangrovi]|uniref:LysR family transcriptional regulator n=1 Tax=Acuticoccus mangrovi TaxID=2796142 RepID=A0A934ITQ9_9HYPH|nr:LysR substrate-binding domain-containing protein [Acuticoccus mangrovi]MBJ3777534.1 LysR family transcriptional regulator [Acuticoccus mangrovi]
MSVKISQLRAFVEVARCGSFTRAAERLSLTQPSLSMAIRQLEDELDLKLFDRTTRRLGLTDEGAKFLPTVTRLVEEFDAAVAGARLVAERRSGRVSLAVLPSIASMFLPAATAAFSARYPAIKVHLREDNSSGIWGRVARNEVDFGIAGEFQPDAEVEFTPIFSDRFGAVFRNDHPLAAGGGPLRWSDLLEHRLIGLAADTGIQPLIDMAQSIPDEIRLPVHEVSNILTALSLVEAGLGITAIPAFAAMLDRHPTLVFRPLVRPVLSREIGFVTRRGRSLSPSAEAMREVLVESLDAMLRAPAQFIGNIDE